MHLALFAIQKQYIFIHDCMLDALQTAEGEEEDEETNLYENYTGKNGDVSKTLLDEAV